MRKTKKNTAIILAGGTGRRMRGDVPKQFSFLGGIPVIAYSLNVFDSCEEVSDIVVVCHPGYLEDMERLVFGKDIRKPVKVVPGGETRQSSSFSGLENCPPDTDYVLIHDSARPLVSRATITSVLEAAIEEGAAGPAIDTTDTIVEQAGAFISGMPDRTVLKRVQTPQAFRFNIITEAHEKARETGINDSSDDCGLVIAYGGKVKVVRGDSLNIKLTSSLDLELAECIIRKGFGKDIETRSKVP